MAYKGKGTIVNRTGLADVFGVSLTTVDTWVKRGCPVQKRAAGKGDAWEFNTLAVHQWLSDQEVEKATGGNLTDEGELKRRKLAAETLKAELELAKAKGEVAPVFEFERAQANVFATLRTNIMNVPQRVVVQLIGETDETRFKDVLRAELALALEATANADLVLADDEETEE
jgi:phage terminase Nu1 subunit (DNA packaging protein)